MSKRIIAAMLVAGTVLFTGCNTAVTQQTQTPPAATATVTWCITEPQKSEKCYDPVAFAAGQSAYDTLVALDTRESSVSFKATDYGESGYFVDTVNGVPGTAQAFWKLFYNSAEAQVGISSITPTSGDKFSFIFEAVRP